MRIEGRAEIWVKRLAGNRAAVLLLNRDPKSRRAIELRASDVGFTGRWTARDLFGRVDLGTFESSLTREAPPHGGWFLLVARR